MKTSKIKLKLLILVLCLFSQSALAQQLSGTIEKVIVYRGQALIARRVEVDLPQGTSELVVNNLPAQIVPESLYAQTDDSLTVLSVRYRERAVKGDTREEVRQLDKQINELKSNLYHAERKKQHLDNQWSMFISLRDFTVTAEKTDLKQGLLSFKPVSELAEFIQKKGQEYIDQTLGYEDQIAELKENLELLNRKRAEIDAGRSRNEREAVLFLNSHSGKKASILLNYLVNGANWVPQYNLRANPEKSSIQIEYNAVVHQASGENWDGVSLSLSTAEPSMVAAPPVLEPMMVRLASGLQITIEDGPRSQTQQMAMAQNEKGQSKSESFKALSQSRIIESKKGKVAERRLNEIANENQAIIFNADMKAAEELQKQVAEITRTEGVSITYLLPGRLSLPSRNDQ